MNQKFNKLIALTLVVALAVGLVLAGMQMAGRLETHTERVDMLYQENEQLWAQVHDLQAQLEKFMTVTSFSSWDLDAAAWADSTGADV